MKVRLLIFTILIPGFVTGYIPYILSGGTQYIDLGYLKYAGLLSVFTGILFYLRSAKSFLLNGKGTPAIWFTKKLKFLIGEEPFEMVSTGLYKYSRNPMYLGIILIIIGEAVYFESENILIYSILLAVFFHLVVVFLEEPHLKRKFGAEYNEYLGKTPRWFGIPKN